MTYVSSFVDREIHEEMVKDLRQQIKSLRDVVRVTSRANTELIRIIETMVQTENLRVQMEVDITVPPPKNPPVPEEGRMSPEQTEASHAELQEILEDTQRDGYGIPY